MLAAITAASPDSGVWTADGSVEQLVRAGITEMQATGVTPSVVVLNPDDAGSVDTRTMADAVNRWPYGLGSTFGSSAPGALVSPSGRDAPSRPCRPSAGGPRDQGSVCGISAW